MSGTQRTILAVPDSMGGNRNAGHCIGLYRNGLAVMESRGGDCKGLDSKATYGIGSNGKEANGEQSIVWKGTSLERQYRNATERKAKEGSVTKRKVEE